MNKFRISLLIILIFAFSLQITGQDDGEVSLPQFLLPEFSEGMIRLKNGQTRSLSHTSATTTYSSINVDGATYNLKMPSDFTVALNPVFWIRVDYEMHSFTKQSQFLKIFPGKENELKAFIKKNRIKFDRREHLVRLVEYCNSLI